MPKVTQQQIQKWTRIAKKWGKKPINSFETQAERELAILASEAIPALVADLEEVRPPKPPADKKAKKPDDKPTAATS